MLDSWSVVALIIFLVTAGAVSVFVSVILNWSLSRRTLALEYDVAELNGRLLKEVKTRAGNAGVRSRAESAELLEKLSAQPVKPPAPWYDELIHPDLKR
jgi:hypothetical protein